MQDVRSSNRGGGGTAKSSRLSSLHVGISAFAALAGVVFAGVQAFGPGTAPINVTVALDKQGQTGPASNLDVAKTGGVLDAVNAVGKGDITAATLQQPAVQTLSLIHI